MTRQIDLISMGYREMRSGVWGKPIAHQFLLFEEGTEKLSQWFRSVAEDDELCLWKEIIYSGEDEDGSFLFWLKNTESILSDLFTGSISSSFQFAKNNEAQL